MDHNNSVIPNKRRSKVWQYFEIINSDKAKCNYCNKILHFRGSTFNLKRHLENRHKHIDVSEMLRKYKKPNIKYVSEPKNEFDSENSIYFTEELNGELSGLIEETQDVLIDTSVRSQETSEAGLETRNNFVNCSFENEKNKSEGKRTEGNENPTQNYNIEISKFIPTQKKHAKNVYREHIGKEEANFRETQIFGDFVASQLRILSKTKREKLQILIQRAILDVVCEESYSQ